MPMKIKSLIALLVLLIPSFAGATAYYVDPSAGGTHVGTYANPFSTLAQINAKSFSTSDCLYFKVGTTLNAPAGEYLNIDWVGTSGSWVTVGAYYGENLFGLNGGARPIIYGSNAAPAHSSSNGLINLHNYSYAYKCQNKFNAYVIIRDLEIDYSGDQGITAYGVGYVQIINNYITYPYSSNGISVAYTDHFTVDGNTVLHTRQSASGAGGAIEIDDNNSQCTGPGDITNNIVGYGSWEGIGVYTGAADVVVDSNIVYNNDSFAIYTGQGSHNVVISNNLVYNTSSLHVMEGLCLDDEQYFGYGNTYGVVFTGNTVINAASGIMLADSYYNDNSSAYIKWISVYNNDFIDQYTGKYHYNIWSSGVDTNWAHLAIKNNVSYILDGALEARNTSPNGVAWSNNIFSSSVSGNAATNAVISAPGFNKTSGWQSITNGTLSLDGTDWQAASVSSACVNAGTSLTTIATSAIGTASVTVSEPAYFGRSLYFGIDNNNDGVIDFIDQVTSVNYSTAQVTFAGSHNWTSGGKIYRAISSTVSYYGTAPDIGADEFVETTTPDPEPEPAVTSSARLSGVTLYGITIK